MTSATSRRHQAYQPRCHFYSNRFIVEECVLQGVNDSPALFSSKGSEAAAAQARLRQINFKIRDHGRMTGVPRVNSRGSFPMTYATLMVHCDLDPGRDNLVVPAESDVLRAERILIAWKDTRESRRAVFDALPLLRLCQKAIVAEIDEDKDPDLANRRVEDVVSWLQCHGINAAAWSEPVREAAAAQLESLAAEEAADLVVAGAYGHGRIREWVFGGVTQDFLRRSSRCHLLSH
jgi:nucleotide-binding universal stress UspA family protein